MPSSLRLGTRGSPLALYQARTVARLIEDADAKDRLLKQLIGDFEPAYAEQWRDLGADYQHKMLAGIVGFELQVLDLQCKIKINQHRPHTMPKMHAMYATGTANEQALAGWMTRLGLLGGPDPT